MQELIIESIHRLNKAAQKNKLVVFVGSGVSVNSGMPTWEQVVKSFAQAMDMPQDISPDDYLRIPQIYFNERKYKEYYDKVYQIFGRKSEPNKIHSEVLKLKPQSIVTTNYDDLIERAAEQRGIFYHVVTQDQDLPYAPDGKLILKMHGDLRTKNIVLKEDDYLSYKSNFKLIETYVRSLFSANVVLFVGFSASDPNFGLIFQAVKDVLLDDFQPAYLLEVAKPFDRKEYEYYKNRGINILYYDSISDKLESIKRMIPDLDEVRNLARIHPLGERLYDFLYVIRNASSLRSDLISWVVGRLSVLDELNFILPSYIISAIGLPGVRLDLFDKRYVNVYESDIVELIGNIKSDKVYRRNFIRKNRKEIRKLVGFLKRAGIEGITIPDDYRSKVILRWQCDLDNLIDKHVGKRFHFDTEGFLEEVGNRLVGLDLTNRERYFLKLAYAHYCSRDYKGAFELLCKISASSVRSKNFFDYFISEYNIKSSSKLIVLGADETLRQIVEYEERKTELEEILLSAPAYGLAGVKQFRSIIHFTEVYKLIISLTNLLTAIEDAKETIESGGYSSSSDLWNIYRSIRDFWLFVNCNYLMIEHYSEVRSLYTLAAKAMLASYSIDPSRANGRHPFFPSNIQSYIPKLATFDYFTLFFIISNVRPDDLKDALERYLIEGVEVDGNDVIERLVGGFSLLVKDDPNVLHFTYDARYNLLNLTSRLRLTAEQVESLFEGISQLLSGRSYIKTYEYINIFLHNLYKTNKGSLSEAPIRKALSIVLNKVANNEIDFQDLQGLNQIDLVESLVTLLKEVNSSYVFNDVISAKRLALNTKLFFHPEDEAGHDVLETFIIPLFKVSSPEIKKIFKEVVVFYIKRTDIQLVPEKVVDTIYMALMEGIVTPTDRIIEGLSLSLKAIADRRDEIVPDPLFFSIVKIGILKSASIIDHDQLVSLIDAYRLSQPLAHFFLDPQTFDFDRFDTSWLSYLDDEAKRELTKNPDIRWVVLGKLIESLHKRYPRDRVVKHAVRIFEAGN